METSKTVVIAFDHLPPIFNDWGDEPDDSDRARAMLAAMTVQIDSENPLASQVVVS
jgi:hypothetical protein